MMGDDHTGFERRVPAMLSGLMKLIGRLTTRPWPEEPEIRLTEDGFVVARGEQTLFRVRWPEVREVFAFKMDLFTTDCICLGFRVSDAGDFYRVDEEMPGYADLVEAVEVVYPDHNKKWWSQVAFPAFAANRTTVWSRATY
jgi:hypothetical protein